MSATPIEIAQLWRHVNRQMRSLFRSTSEAFELPSLSMLLLRHIRSEPGITVSDLARRVGVSKSHTSTLTEQLVRDGYVEKRSDPGDQRLISLFVTDQAKRTLEKMGERAEAFWATIFQEFPADELDNIERFLKELLKALEQVNSRKFDQEYMGEPHPSVEVADP